MNEHSLAVFLSALKSYPIKLARKIGCREAILWYDLFITYGNLEFQFRPESCYLLGIIDGKEIFDNLINLEYIVESRKEEENTFVLSFNKIISEAGGFEYEELPFEDSEFKTLLTLYENLLKSKGHRKTRKEICKCFKDKSLEQSKAALKKAVDNKWNTLYFDDRFQENTRGSSSRHRTGFNAGGGNNSTPTSDLQSEEI